MQITFRMFQVFQPAVNVAEELSGRLAMIQTIDLIFDLGGKTDSMQLITTAQSAHNLAYFADLANRGRAYPSST